MYFSSAEQRGKTAFLDQQATISFLQLNIQLAFDSARNIAGSWSTVYPPGLPDPFLPSLPAGWLPVFPGACGYSPPGTEFCVSLCSSQPISPACLGHGSFENKKRTLSTSNFLKCMKTVVLDNLAGLF